MSDDSNDQEQYNQLATVKFNPNAGFEFTDLDGMFRAAKCYLQSGLAPTSFRTPQQLIICWAYAAELGLRPFQAVAGISVINNRIGIMGDLALAMVRNSGKMVGSPKVKHSGEGDSLKCEVTIQRKDSEAKTFSYSVKQAKTAQIYERSSTWKGYPERMTYYRALGFGLRDEFSDILKGMYITEELEDFGRQEEAQTAKENVRFVDVETGEELKPAPSAKPPLETQLAQEHPEAAARASEKKAPLPETQFGPSADLAPDSLPDEIDMSPPSDAKPWWVDHVIRGVKSFTQRKEPDGTIVPITRTVGSLSPAEMSLVEARWIPEAHKQISRATDDQLKDLKAFEERIAHDKTAKPW